MNRAQLHRMIDLVLDMGESLMNRAPVEAISHLRSAKRESLLAMRALLDHALARLESQGQKHPEQKDPEGEGPRAIPVE